MTVKKSLLECEYAGPCSKFYLKCRMFIFVSLQIGSAEDGSESGLSDNELEAATATLQSLASTLECSCVKLRERRDLRGIVAQFLIRKLLDESGK